MSVETEVTIMIAILPFLAVWGLLVLSRRVAVAREACVARQIALTDAIHRELGAVAAPEVRRSRSGTWIVSVRLPWSVRPWSGRSGASPTTCSVDWIGWTVPVCTWC